MPYLNHSFKLRSLQVIHSVQKIDNPRMLLASLAWDSGQTEYLGTPDDSPDRLPPVLVQASVSSCNLWAREQHPWVCSWAWTTITLNTRQCFTVKQTQMNSSPQASSTPRTQISKGKDSQGSYKRTKTTREQRVPDTRKSSIIRLPTKQRMRSRTAVTGWGRTVTWRLHVSVLTEGRRQSTVERTEPHLSSVLSNTSRTHDVPFDLPGRTNTDMGCLRRSFLRNTAASDSCQSGPGRPSTCLSCKALTSKPHVCWPNIFVCWFWGWSWFHYSQG